MSRPNLEELFPKLFQGDNPAYFGVECREGWDELLVELCEQLTCLGEWEGHYPTVLQIKEKFGTLRFYVSSATTIQNACIHYAEDMSAQTCEVCGKWGRLRKGSWLRTLCDEHHKKTEAPDTGV